MADGFFGISWIHQNSSCERATDAPSKTGRRISLEVGHFLQLTQDSTWGDVVYLRSACPQFHIEIF
jgi:hypothetical protein